MDRMFTYTFFKHCSRRGRMNGAVLYANTELLLIFVQYLFASEKHKILLKELLNTGTHLSTFYHSASLKCRGAASYHAHACISWTLLGNICTAKQLIQETVLKLT